MSMILRRGGCHDWVSLVEGVGYGVVAHGPAHEGQVVFLFQ
jgi:hypothetical protein